MELRQKVCYYKHCYYNLSVPAYVDYLNSCSPVKGASCGSAATERESE